jgi:membrane protease YdiL (CAAX protease family)
MTSDVLGDWSPIDLLLVASLCVAIPAYQLTGSLRAGDGRPARSLAKRALRSFVMLGAPLLLLLFDWSMTGRPASALGLAVPVSGRGEAGLAVAIIVSLGAFLASRQSGDPGKREALLARLKDSGMLVQSRAELGTFAALAILIGCGSELLFRGFLFWAFTPLIGVVGSVVVAGLAYGLGHGSKTWRDAIGSLVSAFLFAAGFALTQSLWWLMLLHTVITLQMGLIGYRLSRLPETLAP